MTADDLFILWLEPSIEFHFTPGQYNTGTRRLFDDGSKIDGAVQRPPHGAIRAPAEAAV
jgi:hypothetical protein